MIFTAVIPARGGSKSVKNKNIYLIKKKPLIHYTIENVIKSNAFEHIVVTSDSKKILNICNKYKNIRLIKRPKIISTDKSKTVDAILHSIHSMKLSNIFSDVIIVLEPTSPLRSVKTILEAVDAFKRNKKIDTLISVTETKALYGRISKNNTFDYFEKNIKRRRQDRKPIYKETGTIWGTKTKYVLKNKKIVGGKIHPLIISKNEDLDINDKNDIKMLIKILK